MAVGDKSVASTQPNAQTMQGQNFLDAIGQSPSSSLQVVMVPLEALTRSINTITTRLTAQLVNVANANA